MREKRTRGGEGVKKAGKSAYVLNGCSLRSNIDMTPIRVLSDLAHSLEVVLVGDAEGSEVEVLHPALEHAELLAVGLLPLGLG